MIDLKDGELIELLPEPLRNDTDVICISYALKMAMAKALEYSIATRMYADIDNLPEDILDYMAVEMRLAYYDESFSVETKRELIKNSYISYMEAGTSSAVQGLITTVFGYGEVVEWFDFDGGSGTPGEFDIETGAQLTPELFELFSKTIESVKNESSHLRRIGIEREIDGDFYVGTAISASPRCVITQLISAQVDINQIAYGAVGHSDAPRVIIT